MDNFLERNLPARLISLALAIFLWLFVVNEQDPETTRYLSMRPELRGLPPGLVLIEEDTPTVALQIRGRRSEVLAVAETDLGLYVDLAGATEGENDQKVRLANVPTGIKVLHLEPESLLIHTEKIIQEQLPVRLVQSGVPAKGHELGEGTLAPTQVVLEGPRSKVGQVGRVVARIQVDEAMEDIRAVVPVQVLDKQGESLNSYMKVRPEVVEVHLPIVNLPSKQLPVRPHLVGTVAEGFQIDKVSVEPERVWVFGGEEALAQLDQLETLALDISGTTTNIQRDLRLFLPQGIDPVQEWVKVVVNISPQMRQRSFLKVPLEIDNLKGQLSAGLEPETVDVTVSGPTAVLNSLREGDLRAFVDAAGLEPGRHRLGVQLELPGGLQGVLLEPEDVVVHIS
jgi:YbbR domain-containing protein